MAAYKIPSGAHWLWLDPVRHPDRVKAPCTEFQLKDDDLFTLAEFTKTVSLPRTGRPHRLTVDAIFADTKFRLTVNGRYIGTGPVAAGGDWGNTLPMPKQYANKIII